MGHPRSEPESDTLPPALSLLAMVLGTGGMLLAATATGRQLGLRHSLLVSETVLVLPALLLLPLNGVPLRALRIGPPPAASLALSLLGGATLWLASLGLIELQYAVWAPPPHYLQAFRALHDALRPKDAADALLSVTAVALAPALCEEVLVRGIVLPSLARALGASLAVLASAGLFGLIHLDPFRFPFTFAVGLVLGVVRLRAGSLIPPIVAHATLNALTFLAVPVLDDPTNPMPTPRPLVGATLLLVGATLTTLLFRPLRR